MMMRLVCLLLLCSAASALQKTFTGYELVSFMPKDPADTDALRSLGEEYSELDFWTECVPGGRCNVLVPPSLLPMVKATARTRGWEYTVLENNIQQLVTNGSQPGPTSVRRTIAGSTIDHSNYHGYYEIQQHLAALALEFPDNMRVDSLPYMTHGYLPVRVVEIFGTGSNMNRPAIIVDAGIHAREWISPAANLYFLEKLLRDYSAGDVTAMQMLDNYDWYLVPVANPDGYEYSRTTDRMWRKNRRYISRNCYGVDLNRNFDSKFGTVGTSSRCSSDIYPGTEAFSEPETANLRDLVVKLGTRLKSYLSIHAYSQFLLVPWGNVETVSRPANAAELDRVGLMMTAALKVPYGKVYKYGTAWELLAYAASGAAEDWALTHTPGIYAYCYELRPDENDSRGFVLPPSEIVDVGEEYYASLATLAREMKV